MHTTTLFEENKNPMEKILGVVVNSSKKSSRIPLVELWHCTT